MCDRIIHWILHVLHPFYPLSIDTWMNNIMYKWCKWLMLILSKRSAVDGQLTTATITNSTSVVLHVLQVYQPDTHSFRITVPLFTRSRQCSTTLWHYKVKTFTHRRRQHRWIRFPFSFSLMDDQHRVVVPHSLPLLVFDPIWIQLFFCVHYSFFFSFWLLACIDTPIGKDITPELKHDFTCASSP